MNYAQSTIFTLISVDMLPEAVRSQTSFRLGLPLHSAVLHWRMHSSYLPFGLLQQFASRSTLDAGLAFFFLIILMFRRHLVFTTHFYRWGAQKG